MIISLISRGRKPPALFFAFYDEAERCDRLLMMLSGEIVALGSPADLRSEVEERIGKPTIINSTDAARLTEAFAPKCQHISRYGNNVLIYLNDRGNGPDPLAYLSRSYSISSIRKGDIPFEDIFIHYVEAGK